MTHRKNSSTSSGITQEVTIITARVSTKRLTASTALSVSEVAVSEIRSRIEATSPSSPAASASGAVSSESVSAVLIVASMVSL